MMYRDELATLLSRAYVGSASGLSRTDRLLIDTMADYAALIADRRSRPSSAHLARRDLRTIGLIAMARHSEGSPVADILVGDDTIETTLANVADQPPIIAALLVDREPATRGELSRPARILLHAEGIARRRSAGCSMAASIAGEFSVAARVIEAQRV